MTTIAPGFFLFCHQDLTELHFSSLLNMCANRTHECFQQAWTEFDRRYRDIIFGRIRLHLRRWNKASDTDLAEEVLCEVIARLIVNDFRAIMSFRARNDEAKFLNFLNVICRNTTNQVVVSMLIKSGLSLDEGLLQEISVSENEENAKDVYYGCVFILRDKLSHTQKKPFHQERDILVFLLRLLSGFRAKEVAKMALLEITPGNIENVIYRLKE